jgi:hypothetical protein
MPSQPCSFAKASRFPVDTLPRQPPPNLPLRCAQGEGLSGAADTTSAHVFVSWQQKSDGEHPATVDPEGGAQDVRRFSTRQDAASKNPGQLADGRFAPAPESFLW